MAQAMTLHEAMRLVLQTAPGRRMAARELCEQVNRRGLYRMRDGRPVEPQQIHARANNYRQLFSVSGGFIGLLDAESGRGTEPARAVPEPAVQAPAEADPHQWPWEGAVQQVFVRVLTASGWSIISTADTATKEHGVDVLAAKGSRRLGAEVKGCPSRTYADRLRAGERKRTAPTTQAGHWFSQALRQALMLLDTHPGHESLVVLPDESRYRDLARGTRTGSGRAGVHVVFLRKDGALESETWSP